MAITPADIQAQTFSEAKRGYDPGEVDVFLEQLASEVDAMLSKIVDLKNRLTSTEQELTDAKVQLAQAQSQAQQASAAAPAPVNTYSATERQISAALITAQQSADRIVDEARKNAERIRNEADAKAREVIRQALAEKQNEQDEIARLKDSREEFRAEYLKLLQHFIDDAQNSFPSDMLQTTPSGSDASQGSAVVSGSAFTTAPEDPQAHEVSDPYTASDRAGAPVADPFAPSPSFDFEDLD